MAVTDAGVVDAACEARGQIADQLGLLIDFWRTRAVDPRGGYHTCFDAHGALRPEPREKYLVTQCRLVWAFSEFADFTGDRGLLNLARHGVDHLLGRFLDKDNGGWFWKVDPAGQVVDDAKVTYGQSFACYALATYGRISGDSDATRVAADTFTNLQLAVYDVRHGGYRETYTRDWSSAAPVRKTLDTHLHLLESLTELVRATGGSVHRQRLRDVRQLIVDRMIDPVSGAGGNQFAADLTPVRPIALPRTWVAERKARSPEAASVGATSYGHNLELAWLLARADGVLDDEPPASGPHIERLAHHALTYGLDRTYGGIFREGPHRGPATDRDKEFWQNSEALVGFLTAYHQTSDNAYFQAFLDTWRFARTHLVHPRFGEWRVRTTKDGMVTDGDLGNPWKVCYHTGRAAVECLRLLRRITGEKGAQASS